MAGDSDRLPGAPFSLLFSGKDEHLLSYQKFASQMLAPPGYSSGVSFDIA